MPSITKVNITEVHGSSPLTVASTTKGNLLVVILGSDVSTNFGSAPTDNKGNTYTAFTGYNDFNPSAGNHGESAWYGWAIDGFGGVTTITYSTTGVGTTLAFFEFNSTNGWPATPIDATSTHTLSTAGTTFTSNATSTLAQASEVAVGAWYNKLAASVTVTDNSPWNLGTDSGLVNSDCQQHTAYQIVAATTALSYTGTQGSTDYGATIMTFLDNAPAGGPIFMLGHL